MGSHCLLQGQSPKAVEIKAKINKWYLLKLISFCTAKEIINKTKRYSIGWEKIFANNGTNKGLIIAKIHKQLIQFSIKQKPSQKVGRRLK